jgi:RNA polymerase sigma-70 factor, ECF subfamily
LVRLPDDGGDAWCGNAVRADLTEQLTELLPRMRRFACGLSGSLDRGDELVQNACERLLKHHHRLRPDTRLDSWLYQVIRNLHLDALRATSVRDRGAHQIRQAAELQPVVESTLERQMALHEIQAQMAKLSEGHRSVLMLVCVEGLSYKEAAEVLQVPMGTVTSRLVRARKALMELLGEDNVKLELEGLL